jgi:hypothetical protein
VPLFLKLLLVGHSVLCSQKYSNGEVFSLVQKDDTLAHFTLAFVHDSKSLTAKIKKMNRIETLYEKGKLFI